MFSALGALSNYHRSAVATGTNGVPTDHGAILRIISPATVPDPSVYQSWDPYIRHVQANNVVTPIVGEFMGGITRGLISPHASTPQATLS